MAILKKKIFEIFDLLIFFGFSKGPASNAEVNPHIEKQQLPDNDDKNLLGRIRVLNL